MAPDGSQTSAGDFKAVTQENLAPYKPGASDTRPWGTWEALSVKVENNIVTECEKRITVNPSPMGILSLQMHEGREEIWKVEQGTLTVILNGQKINVPEGESIFIPRGAIHCMINETDEPVIVHETQKGICREADNHRLEDAHGRKDPVSDETHCETILKTMINRYGEHDDSTDNDSLMAIFIDGKPSARADKFLEILKNSRAEYKPFADKVASSPNPPQQVAS